MKLAFFLIAFSLLFLRLYFSWTGFRFGDRDRTSITVSDGHKYEKIKYAGKIKLTDDEAAIKSMSPGGYLEYTKNDTKLIAESNLEGQVSYKIYEDGDRIYTGNRPNTIIKEAIHEMIAYGFDAANRMKRIYREKGYSGLLAELDHLQSGSVRVLYLEQLFKADSLSTNNVLRMIEKIASLDSDVDKVRLLKKLPANSLLDPAIREAWFNVVVAIGSDMDKLNVLHQFAEHGPLTDELFDRVIGITAKLGSDMDKQNMLKQLVSQGMVTTARMEKVLDIVARLGSDIDKSNMLHELIKAGNTGPYFYRLQDIAAKFGSDLDKINMYKQLLQQKNLTEDEWVSMIGRVEQILSDLDKVNLLVYIAQGMPPSDHIKSVYLKTAKTIHSDIDYRNAVKAVE